MFGPRLSTVFASRWKALLWALGIMATAYCTVPSDEQVQGAQDAVRAYAESHPADGDHPANPWAKTAN